MDPDEILKCMSDMVFILAAGKLHPDEVPVALEILQECTISAPQGIESGELLFQPELHASQLKTKKLSNTREKNHITLAHMHTKSSWVQ